MTTIKFTANVSGNTPDELEAKARKAANDFYRDLPEVPKFVGAEVSYDPEYFAQRVQSALKEAEDKAAAWKAEHGDEEDFEAIEVVPAEVTKYDGWFEFSYDVNQSTGGKKTLNEVWADQAAASVTAATDQVASAADAERPVRPENDPKYQDAF